jgi:hypothetical protein
MQFFYIAQLMHGMPTVSFRVENSAQVFVLSSKTYPWQNANAHLLFQDAETSRWKEQKSQHLELVFTKTSYDYLKIILEL